MARNTRVPPLPPQQSPPSTAAQPVPQQHSSKVGGNTRLIQVLERAWGRLLHSRALQGLARRPRADGYSPLGVSQTPVFWEFRRLPGACR